MRLRETLNLLCMEILLAIERGLNSAGCALISASADVQMYRIRNLR